MRPMLRPDSYCAAVDGGAYLLTPARPVRLTGASIAAWIQRLTPYLDGRATLAELIASLPPDRRAMVEQVVTALHEAGVVRDLDESDIDDSGPDGDGAGELTGAEAREYAPELSYLGYFLDRAAAAMFARYRDRPALVVGSGSMLGPLLAAGLRSGLRQVRVAAAAGALAGLAYPPRRDPAQRVTVQRLADPAELGRPAAVARMLAGAGLVLHAVEPDQPAGVLERACAATGVPLGQAVATGGGEVWLVPVGTDRALGWSAAAGRAATAPEPAGPPWATTERAGSGTAAGDPAGPPPGAADLAGPPPGPGDLMALPAAAARLVQGGLRALTGVAEPGPRTHLIRVWPGGYRSERHRFLPHPFALPAAPTAAADLPARVAALAAGQRLAEPEFSQRAVRCLDPRLGLFTFPDNDWEQLPLQVVEAVVADPAGRLPAGHRARTIGSGFTDEAARCEAARRALARYASLLVDPRRLVDPATRQPLATDPTADPPAGAVWGYEVDAPDRVRLVPAAAAFPALAGPAPVGLGAGYDWSEAVTAGLAAHARAQAVAGIGRTTTPYPPVDLAKVAGLLDEAGERCRRLLTDLAELPACFDLTGPAGGGIPTFAFCQGATTVAVTAAGTAGAALGEGLREVLLAVQARADHRARYAPLPAPPLPARLRGPDPEPGQGDREQVPPEQAAARLRPAGRVAVAVPLDHDPGLAEILPYLVQVVMLDG